MRFDPVWYALAKKGIVHPRIDPVLRALAKKPSGGDGGGTEPATRYYADIIERTLSGEYTNATATSVGNFALFECNELTKADFPAVTNIAINVFESCGLLSTLILRSETVCSLATIYAFLRTPIQSGTGYIYVPRVLVDTYKAATNWSSYANQIRAIEDYPEITGGGN